MAWFNFFILEFVIVRDEKNGGNLEFSTYEDLEKCFASQELHPADLKAATEIYINKLLDPIRKAFESPELKKLASAAYPPPPKKQAPKQGRHLFKNILLSYEDFIFRLN